MVEEASHHFFNSFYHGSWLTHLISVYVPSESMFSNSQRILEDKQV